MGNLLFDEHPLIVNPILAKLIGLNEAIILQQVHYWIEIEKNSKDQEVIEKHYHDSRWWTYNTYDQWQKQFPFWSIATIKRTVGKLESDGLLISGHFNEHGYDRTKWYTIDYELLESLEMTHSIKMTQCKVSNRADAKYQNDPSNTLDFSETSSKDFIKCKMVQNSKNVCTNDFSYDVVRNQIKQICEEDYPEVDVEAMQSIIIRYCERYKYYIGKYHPKMRNSNYKKIVDFIVNSQYGVDPEAYADMMDKYFETYFPYKKVDYNINHFLTDGITRNRNYELM